MITIQLNEPKETEDPTEDQTQPGTNGNEDDNYNAIIAALEKEKSNNTLKGDLIKQVFITSTMGVSYKLKLGKSI